MEGTAFLSDLTAVLQFSCDVINLFQIC